MSRTLPNLGLKGANVLGVDDWGDDMNLNLLKLSALVQAGVISKVNAVPGSPVEGDCYILSETEPTHSNTIAVYDGGAWLYIMPSEGWLVWNRTTNKYTTFNGVAWSDLALGGGGSGSLPSGGSTGQVLTKLSSVDGDADWVTPSGGGGGSARIGVAFHWTGSAVVIDKTNGVASVTRTALGRYQITFTTAFADTFYGVTGTSNFDPGSGAQVPQVGVDSDHTKTVNGVGILVRNTINGTTFYDPGIGATPDPLVLIFDTI